MKKEKKYTITNLSDKQLRMIQKSLDLYARMGCLQFERIVLDEISWNSKFSDSYRKNRDEIDQYIKMIRYLIVKEVEEYKDYNNYGNWSLGIAGPDTPKSCQSAYEMSSLIQDLFSIEGGGQAKGKLDLCEEEDIIVREADIRIEKIVKLLDKMGK